MSKRCVEDSGLTTPPKKKLRRSSIIAQSTLRGAHVTAFAKRRFVRSHRLHLKRHVKSILLLSLNAHNHVDDYSGTLGGVRKVHMSALVTSPKN